MDDSTEVISKALEQVGPRLKQLRARRGVTLTALAEATGSVHARARSASKQS
jgi:transcriptional regulator with XRE-family HTH domain